MWPILTWFGNVHRDLPVWQKMLIQLLVIPQTNSLEYQGVLCCMVMPRGISKIGHSRLLTSPHSQVSSRFDEEQYISALIPQDTENYIPRWKRRVLICESQPFRQWPALLPSQEIRMQKDYLVIEASTHKNGIRSYKQACS